MPFSVWLPLLEIPKLYPSRKHAEATKRKIGLANKGKKQSLAQREASRIRALGNTNMLGKKHTEETKRKMSKSKVGIVPVFSKEARASQRAKMTRENHPNWKGGCDTDNRLLRKTCDFQAWRKKVFERDNYTCIICGERGGELNPHHILPFADYPQYRFDIDNGMTLCREHHYNLHTKSLWLGIYNSAFAIGG